MVTPNLDHAVMLRTNLSLVDAYSKAALSVADGMPLIWTSRLFGNALPGRVAGSDLVPALLKDAPKGTRVYLLGASDEAAQAAQTNIKQAYPHLEMVGRLSPPRGFEHSSEWSERIVTDIRSTQAELVILGLGAPKQELWISAHCDRLPSTVVICAGATIDFLAHYVRRAPVWVQKSGFEWLYRVFCEPRRLIGRYTRDLIHLPRLVLDDVLASWKSSKERETRPAQSPPRR